MTEPTQTTEALIAWRSWRKAESSLSRAANLLNDPTWSPEVSAAYQAARVTRDDAWRLVCRLMDAASLGLKEDPHAG